MRPAPALALGALLALAAVAGGCGGSGEKPDSDRARGRLTVYVSAPAHGVEAAAGRAAVAGARAALADADGRAARRRVRIVRLSSTKPGDAHWDPGAVEAGADRAAEDHGTIAYVGELDRGASAVSLPVLNRKGILQVSPADSLTSLTRSPPGRPRAGPERYYPDGVPSFVRLVAPDLIVADALLGRIATTRRVALVSGEGPAARELAGMVAFRLRGARRDPVAEVALRADAEDVTGPTDEIARAGPQAIVVTGSGEPAGLRLIAALAKRLPGVPVLGDEGIATTSAATAAAPSSAAFSGILPAAAQSRRARGLLRRLGSPGAAARPEALYGYAAMALALDAVARGGTNRRAVVRAARRPGRRRSVLGPLAIGRSGDARPARLAELGIRPGGARLEGVAP